MEDQNHFASISGDYNPMHVDALHARRTQAGAPVVHGIHLLLWALESFATTHPDAPPLQSLRAQFNKFVYLNERVEVVLAQPGPTEARLNLSVDNASRSKLTLKFGPTEMDCPQRDSSLQQVPFSQTPLNLGLEEMSGRSGKLLFRMTPEDAVEMFPAATKWLGATRIRAVAASTHLVGMVCPGLHSIYSELSVTTCSASADEESLVFHVTATDPRFRSVEQEIAGGGLTGRVKSFARTPAVEQVGMRELAGVVHPAEFAGSLALIVGGSRGLGELTAKLIAAGGGRVIVTWHRGKEDAERVAEEIRSAGGICETLAYDATKSAGEQLGFLPDAPTHAYYFATPGIFRPQSEIYYAERLKDFLTVYVEGFWQLAMALRVRRPGVSLFYPSSIFVAERPRGMTEYTMAKAAGEVLCADMNLALAPMRVIVNRLPRLPTDQTASILASKMASPVETMLKVIREVQH